MSLTLSTSVEVLEECVASIDDALADEANARLAHHKTALDRRASEAADKLLAEPLDRWEAFILGHRAHRHAWYDNLADTVSVNQFAAFLLENWGYPPFVALLEKIASDQVCERGRQAIARNLADETTPVPHAVLMRRMMEGVIARASGDIDLQDFPSLIDRTLTFYGGYYGDSWHLVGSVFATELMAQHRVTYMGRGLARLGLSAPEREFVAIHSECDDQHAREWLEEVIIPSVELSPSVQRSIAFGIASCLETSATYLDDLCHRANGNAIALATVRRSVRGGARDGVIAACAVSAGA